MDFRAYEWRCLPSPTHYTAQEAPYRHPDSRPPQPKDETKVVQFKDTTREEEDRNIYDLTECMHRLSVVQNLPKPVINQQMPPVPALSEIKHSVNAQPAALPSDAHAPVQQVSSMCKAPPHLFNSFNNCSLSARIEEVAEAYIV